MKKLENKKTNKERGITMVVLVVTIIVLLILARNINCNIDRR